MAIVAGTIVNVSAFSTPAGFKTTSGGKAVECAIIDATFTGTYDQTDEASIANVHSAIAASKRDGKTIALISAGCVAPGVEGAATLLGASKVATSANTITCQLNGPDMTTERAASPLAPMSEGVKFAVMYTAV